MKIKLTAKAVAALTLPPGKTDHIEWDAELPGFGYRLRLGAGGGVRRSWVTQYKRSTATRRLLLGAAEVLSAEQARTMAKRALGKVANGEDPQAERRDRRGKDRVSLKSMIDEYLLQKESRIRPRTFVEVRRYLTFGDYFRPLFGMPVDQIGRKDVASRLVTITREHGTIPAARARATLSAFFVWCLQNGLSEQNPVVGTLRPRDSAPRERVLSFEELAAIWKACGDDDYGRIIKLLILLASRRGEVGGMAWTEFSDFDGPTPTWTLPARRSKSGRAHTLPLGPMAVDIVRSAPRMVSRDALFGGRAGCFTAWGRGKPRIDAASGVTAWTLHDLRRSTATHLGDMNIAPHVIEEILGHAGQVRSAISRVYNKSRYFGEVHAALLAWEDRIHALVEGTERKIVPMLTPTVAS